MFLCCSFNPGTGEVWLEDIDCGRADTRIVDCVRPSSASCPHSRDVALNCTNYSKLLLVIAINLM